MYRTCSVSNCSGSNRIVFRFPTGDPDRLFKWVLFAQSELVKSAYLSQSSREFNNLRICLDHFRQTDYKTALGSHRLLSKATPSRKKPKEVLYTQNDLQRQVIAGTSPPVNLNEMASAALSDYGGDDEFVQQLVDEAIPSSQATESALDPFAAPRADEIMQQPLDDAMPSSKCTESVLDPFVGTSQQDSYTLSLLDQIRTLREKFAEKDQELDDAKKG